MKDKDREMAKAINAEFSDDDDEDDDNKSNWDDDEKVISLKISTGLIAGISFLKRNRNCASPYIILSNVKSSRMNGMTKKKMRKRKRKRKKMKREKRKNKREKDKIPKMRKRKMTK